LEELSYRPSMVGVITQVNPASDKLKWC
jgi:hypothetical protein